MPTRASTIITGIENAILGATIDTKAHTGDIWQRMEAADDAALIAKDRTFVVFPLTAPVRNDEIIASQPALASFDCQISIGYTRGGSSAIIDRILDDSERIMYALEEYAANTNAAIANMLQGGSTIAPFDGGLVVEFELTIVYAVDLS